MIHFLIENRIYAMQAGECNVQIIILKVLEPMCVHVYKHSTPTLLKVRTTSGHLVRDVIKIHQKMKSGV